MTDYNKKLDTLVESAKKDGYEFIDGKFVETKQNMFPVMEIFLFDASVYEDTGHYHIFKRTYIIEEKDYLKVTSYCKENDGKEIHMYYDCDDADFIENVDQIIAIYDWGENCSGIDYYDRNVGGAITIRCDNYHKYTDNNECVDLWFSKKEDDDFPIGYISFYKMKKSDFEKAEDVNIELNKFMRDN